MQTVGERKPQNKLENHEIDAILGVMELWCDKLESRAGIGAKRRNWGIKVRRIALAVCCLFVIFDFAWGNPRWLIWHKPAKAQMAGCPTPGSY